MISEGGKDVRSCLYSFPSVAGVTHPASAYLECMHISRTDCLGYLDTVLSGALGVLLFLRGI